MVILQRILDALYADRGAQAVATILVLLAYPAAVAIYNLFFHPLARFHGPKLWAASRLPFVYSLSTGKLIQRQRRFHEKYGEIVRIAPDEISFASERAWDEIYAFRRGHKRALRDKTFATAPNEDVDPLITTTDPKFHIRVRGLLSNSFTEDSLRSHLPDWQRILRGLINITDWINFFTMDVIGDLAFGEAFGCLAKGEYHSWVRTLYSYLKLMSLAAIARYYPTWESFLQRLAPRSLTEDALEHQRYANQQINKRLDTKTNRPDFLTPFMKNNVNFENMSRAEILSTFNFVIVGGAETSATVLTGLFSHLSRYIKIQQRLCSEIRSALKREEDISIDACKDLVYLDAVLNEGLRMFNPIPSGLPRVVPEGGDTYCGAYLPGGTRIGVRTFAVNRSSEYFHDPDRFVPERWLPITKRPKTYHNEQLTASRPFSVGFHSCLGRPLAWVELRLVICRILWKFDIADDAHCRVDFDDSPVIMMVQKGPVNIRVQVREDHRKQ